MQTKDVEIAELARTVAGLQSALADERSSPTGNGNDVDVDGDELALHDPVVSRAAMRALRERDGPLPPTRRHPCSRLLLLRLHQATHGPGCALAREQPGLLRQETRDRVVHELWSKVTGDHETSAAALATAAGAIARKFATVRGQPSAAMRRWLGDAPTVAPATRSPLPVRGQDAGRGRQVGYFGRDLSLPAGTPGVGEYNPERSLDAARSSVSMLHDATRRSAAFASAWRRSKDGAISPAHLGGPVKPQFLGDGGRRRASSAPPTRPLRPPTSPEERRRRALRSQQGAPAPPPPLRRRAPSPRPARRAPSPRRSPPAAGANDLRSVPRDSS